MKIEQPLSSEALSLDLAFSSCIPLTVKDHIDEESRSLLTDVNTWRFTLTKWIYFVRENLKDLWQQYYQYGLYKPLVFKKVPQGRRWHHFVPAVFIVLMPASLGLGLLYWGFLLPAAVYLMLLTIISVFIQNSLRKKLYSLLVFPCLHLGYGLGFIIGLFKNN